MKSSVNLTNYTVIIPTYNEENNISDCLGSLAGVPEIVIVDSFSDDKTCIIAEEYNVRIFQHKFYSHGDQINWCLNNASYDWIFVLDADERFTPKLNSEICSLVSEGNKTTFRVKRINYFLGKRISHGLWSRDCPVRLFNRLENSYNVQRVHSSLSKNGKIKKLNYSIKHYSYNSVDEYITKMKRFSEGAALDLYDQGKEFRVIECVSRTIYRLFKGYVLHKGYKDGIHGLIIACLEAMYVFLKYVKLWERKT